MPSAARDRFAVLLAQHRGAVLKVARSYAWTPEDRDDLAQEIAAQLWRAFPVYDPQRAFATWLYRIALNVAISFARTHQRRRRHSEPLASADEHAAPGGEPSAETDERLRQLDRVIAGLEPLNRALVLLYLEERSYREIAEILGISETNVATKLSRLKQRMRGELSPEETQ